MFAWSSSDRSSGVVETRRGGDSEGDRKVDERDGV